MADLDLLKDKNILIVDDDQSTCDMLCDELASRGHDCIAMVSPAQAFKRTMEESFDIVLTDLRMPGTDGIEFCERIVTNRPDIPVVVIISGVEGAGKGEVVNRLNEWLDARGVQTFAFWDETDEERDRPRNWRFWRALPAAGEIAIMFSGWPALRMIMQS